jgi:hypothetical protein
MHPSVYRGQKHGVGLLVDVINICVGERSTDKVGQSGIDTCPHNRCRVVVRLTRRSGGNASFIEGWDQVHIAVCAVRKARAVFRMANGAKHGVDLRLPRPIGASAMGAKKGTRRLAQSQNLVLVRMALSILPNMPCEFVESDVLFGALKHV